MYESSRNSLKWNSGSTANLLGNEQPDIRIFMWRLPMETDLRSLLFGVEDLKDPLIGNLVLACQISDAFTGGVAGANLLVAFQFGEVFRENWFHGTGNTVVQEVKHPLDSTVHRGYTGDVEAP